MAPTDDEDMKRSDTQGTSIWRTFILSLIVIIAVALSWSLTTQFSQTALKIDTKHFNAPYCMMWFNTNFMILCYPTYILYEMFRKKKIRDFFRHAQEVFGPYGLTPFQLLFRVLPFLLLWIGANYCAARALLYVSASIATSISSCNAAFVYILGILLLGDKFIWMKAVSVVFAVAGVAVISLGIKGSSGDQQWLGIMLSVISAMSAAVYKVLFKRMLGSADLGQVSLFMSCLGYLNFSLNWVMPVILTQTGVELIEWKYVPWLPMCGAAVLSLTFNFLINFGIALLHPLVISIGMLLGIPSNTVIDIIFRHVTVTGYFLGGTSLIAISFVLIIFPYEMIRKRKNDNLNENNFCDDEGVQAQRQDLVEHL
ncbi:unnamed protein product [Auanema sp. JU1783]|nr:unnamed protein product [Auanema sp. JU1783]